MASAATTLLMLLGIVLVDVTALVPNDEPSDSAGESECASRCYSDSRWELCDIYDVLSFFRAHSRWKCYSIYYEMLSILRARFALLFFLYPRG